MIHNGDCLTVMASMAENSIDAIVTDPPYGLSFMGKDWDYGVPGVSFWREALRVAKPGAHILAFGGTRTYHRLTCAIEDAGWEIRDCLGWIYASGFPKSHNLDNYRGSNFCGCDDQLRGVRQGADDAAGVAQADKAPDLLPAMQRGIEGRGVGDSRPQGASSAQDVYPDVRTEEPGLEGRGDVSEATRELCERPLRSVPASSSVDGADGRLCDGAPFGDGGLVRSASDADGNGPSLRPRPAKQRKNKPRAVAGQPEPQASGAWPTCGGCGKPRIPRGLGSALKPAYEPIILARKPLVGTVAANVQEHGTGALNIDGCRVGTDAITIRGGGGGEGTGWGKKHEINAPRVGRFPANILHDGSEDVLGVFPESKGDSLERKPRLKTSDGFGWSGPAAQDINTAGFTDSGSAARFFYCAKASKRDRGDNSHPTVKPNKLMRYLCRLITPPGGLILDPFTGSGSTGKAAVQEGFRFVGIELSKEYCEIAEKRISGAADLFAA